MKFYIALLLVAFFFATSNAKIFTKCELVSALYKAGIPKDKLRDWACLVQSESSYNSRAVGGPNSDKSYDFGIFQLNSRYWCKIGSVGGDCNLNCDCK
jgi:hypothetical protein